MIISASYKTDIPTFYGEWLMNRLRLGYCKMINPYNRRVIRVPLTADEVDGLVLWTKNIGPFLKHLPELRARGLPFVLQHTINGYPRVLENAVTNTDRSVENVRRVAEEFGPRVCVWRYDTIVMTSLTPPDFHRSNFERIATSVRGAVDEVVISFAHLYRKTLRNLQAAAEQCGISWGEPTPEARRRLTTDLVAIAQSHGIQLTVCSQPENVVAGAIEARCVDAGRFEDVAGRPFTSRLRGNRKECGCFESRDIGEYDTCPHGCVYCYAVQHREIAQRRYRQHDPTSEFLFMPDEAHDKTVPQSSIQLPLFGCTP